MSVGFFEEKRQTTAGNKQRRLLEISVATSDRAIFSRIST